MQDPRARAVIAEVAKLIASGQCGAADDRLRHAVHDGIPPSSLVEAIVELAEAKGTG